MTKRILAIIPARGGSKGIPRKNIIDLNGKPLIAWTIKASLDSNFISKTVVSSDDDEILKISQKYGASVIRRPKSLASDEASSESVMLHTIDSLSVNNEEFDIVILLQPTSPLRTSKDIDDAYEAMISMDATSLISVSEVDNKFLKSFIRKPSGYLESVCNKKYAFMRRQALPAVYLSNGAIYIILISEFLKSKSLFTDKTIEYIMKKNHSIDIDCLDDVYQADKYFR